MYLAPRSTTEPPDRGSEASSNGLREPPYAGDSLLDLFDLAGFSPVRTFSRLDAVLAAAIRT